MFYSNCNKIKAGNPNNYKYEIICRQVSSFLLDCRLFLHVSADRLDDDQIRSLCGAIRNLTGFLQIMAKLMFGKVNWYFVLAYYTATYIEITDLKPFFSLWKCYCSDNVGHHCISLMYVSTFLFQNAEWPQSLCVFKQQRCMKVCSWSADIMFINVSDPMGSLCLQAWPDL